MEIDYYKKYEPIDGKWYITKQLGKGAYGTVFEVERRDFVSEKSALKIISIPPSKSEVDSYREENYELDEKSVTSYFYSFVEEFTKEFQLMSKLKGNSNIVSIEDYDVKKKDGEIGWDIFIRMELLTPINKHFHTHPPTQKDIIKLGIDICKALDVCKTQNIIHRDIKPSNLFISSTGDFKIGDFGVSRTLEKTSSGLSKKGTDAYMAPEVYKCESYNSSVDLYSLGIVMYKLLNNNFEPFRTEKTYVDGEKALTTRMKGDKPLPNPVNADEELSKIIIRACSFDAKERYSSPTCMREELETLLVSKSNKRIELEEDSNSDNETFGVFDSRNNMKKTSDNDKNESYSNQELTRGIFDKPKEKDEYETVGAFSGQETKKFDSNISMKISESGAGTFHTNAYNEKEYLQQKKFRDIKVLEYSVENLKYYRSIHILILLLSIPMLYEGIFYNILMSREYSFFEFMTCFIGGCLFVLPLVYIFRYTIALFTKQHNINSSFESKNETKIILAEYNKREAKFITSVYADTLTKTTLGVVIMIISAVCLLLFGYVEIDSRIHIKIDHTFEEQLAKNIDFALMMITFIITFIIGCLIFKRGKQLTLVREKYRKEKEQNI